MTKLLMRILVICSGLALAACAGSTAPSDLGPDPREGLEELDFELVTDPGSTVSSSEVEGWLTTTDDALNARDFSSAASQAGTSGNYQVLQGMYFEPNTPPGAGFSGRLSVRMQNGAFANNSLQGVLLYLFYIDPAKNSASQLDTQHWIPVSSARGRSGNWFDFQVNALGHFIIAENLDIPRPNENFRVSAFADQSATGTGIDINFFAIPQNGTEPISYTWNMGDGTQLSGASVSHSYQTPGSYNVTLNATDGTGSVAPTISTPIEITSTAPPLSDLDGESLPAVGDDLTFTFSATVVGGRSPFSYEWDFDGDGTTDSTEAPPVDFTFEDYGFYVGTLKITDANGDSITTEIVSDARRIDIGVDVTEVTLGTSFKFTLDAQGLDVSDDVIVDTNDGNTLINPGSSFDYTYSLPGTYVVKASAVRTFEGTDYTVESNELVLTVYADPRPVITGVTPVEVPIGGRVVVSGLQFGSQDDGDEVLLNGLPMIIESWTDTVIEITIADGATDGTLVVSKERDSDPSDPINIIPASPDNPDGRQT